MSNYHPHILNFLFPLLFGVAGVLSLFDEHLILRGLGVILISTAYGSGIWLIVDGYKNYWSEINEFADRNPDILWAYLGLPKPSTTSRVMVQTNKDPSYPTYDNRPVNASEDEMREIAKAFSSGVTEFSERKFAKTTGIKLTRIRQLQKEFESAEYIRLHKAGDTSRSYAFTARGARKLYGYLPMPTILDTTEGENNE